MRLKRIMHGVHGDKPPTIGKDVEILKSGLTRYGRQSGAGEDFFPKPPAGYDPVYNSKTVDAVRTLQELERGSGNTAIKAATGDTGQPTWDVIWQYLDAFRRMQYRAFRVPAPKPAVPDLGPIYQGGKSILLHDLTHETAGVPGFPALDDGWVAGRVVIAPENLKVTEQSGSAGGDAFFARGASTIEYWIGHLVYAPPTGRTFSKGAQVGVIANIPWSQGGPHVHCGVNARPLIGHELVHHTNYTHGAPTIGAQLKLALT
jgi:hypothetical protein